jgi:hypothetical protein
MLHPPISFPDFHDGFRSSGWLRLLLFKSSLISSDGKHSTLMVEFRNTLKCQVTGNAIRVQRNAVAERQLRG